MTNTKTAAEVLKEAAEIRTIAKDRVESLKNDAENSASIGLPIARIIILAFIAIGLPEAFVAATFVLLIWGCAHKPHSSECHRVYWYSQGVLIGDGLAKMEIATRFEEIQNEAALTGESTTGTEHSQEER